jgi:hypothetical protein
MEGFCFNEVALALNGTIVVTIDSQLLDH